MLFFQPHFFLKDVFRSLEMTFGRVPLGDREMDLPGDLFFPCADRLVCPFTVTLDVAVAVFYPVRKHDKKLLQITGFRVTCMVAIALIAMMFVVVG